MFPQGFMVDAHEFRGMPIETDSPKLCYSVRHIADENIARKNY